MLKKKSISMLLAILMVLTSGTVIQAHGNDSANDQSYVVTPFYKYISIVGASISISNTGRAVSSGYVHYIGDYDSTLKIELQRLSGTSWSTVKSWSKSFSGEDLHSLEEVYYVTSGHTYRVMTTATVKNGTAVLETATSTSSEFIY